MHNKNKVNEYKKFTIAISGADLLFGPVIFILKGFDKIIADPEACSLGKLLIISLQKSKSSEFLA